MKVNQTMLTAWPIISARTPPPRLPNRAPYLQARALIQIGWGRQVLIWNPGFSVSDLNSGMGTNLDLMLCWHKSEDVRGHYEKLDMKPFIPLWQHLRPWTKVSEAMNFLSLYILISWTNTLPSKQLSKWSQHLSPVPNSKHHTKS